MSGFDLQKAVAATAVAIAVLIGGFAAIARTSLSSADRDLRDAREQVVALHAELEEQAVRSAAAPLPSAATTPHQQLLRGPEVVETLQALQALGDGVGVVFDEMQALTSADVGKQSFSISGRGTPDAVCGFLSGIERSDRLMIVETGRISSAAGEQLAFVLGVATYHRREGQ